MVISKVNLFSSRSRGHWNLDWRWSLKPKVCNFHFLDFQTETAHQLTAQLSCCLALERAHLKKYVNNKVTTAIDGKYCKVALRVVLVHRPLILTWLLGQLNLMQRFCLHTVTVLVHLTLKEAGGSKMTLWVFDWLPFLTPLCYGHKNSWLHPYTS